MLEWITLDCPYCGEPFETNVDCSAGAQEYIEDCAVCCHPIVFSITLDWNGELATVETRRDD